MQQSLPCVSLNAVGDSIAEAATAGVPRQSESRNTFTLVCPRPHVLGITLAVFTLAVFFSVVRNGFVDWDDGNQIYNNPHLGLGWENLKWMFTNYEHVHRYLPIGWLSYSVDRALFGGGPLSYHAGNLLLHALNSVLVFVLLRKLIRLAAQRQPVVNSRLIKVSDPAAALGALWWAVNPLRVEVVGWASARIYCVAIAFMLTSLLAYLRAASEPMDTRAVRHRWLFLAVICYVFSLFTYPLALAASAVFLTLDVYPLRRIQFGAGRWFARETSRVIVEKFLFMAPGVLILVLTLWTRTGNQNLGAIVDANEPSIAARIMQSLYVWAYYIWKPWAPFHLAPEYSTLLEFDPWSWPFLVSAALVIALTIWFWRLRRKHPVLLAAWICHLALLVPMLGMESFRHYHTTDRYSYLQGICWAVVIAAVFCWFAMQSRRAMVIAVGLLLWTAFCAALIPDQIAIWKDSLSLHGRIVESLGRNPDRSSGSRALRDWARHEAFLGELQVDRKDFASAEASFRHAIATDPALPDPSLSLGRLLAAQGRWPEAVACLEDLLHRQPQQAPARALLGIVLGQAGKLQESARELEQALQLEPADASLHHNYAVTMERLGDRDAAATHYARARELQTGLQR
jgi:hypothetical protein